MSRTSWYLPSYNITAALKLTASTAQYSWAGHWHWALHYVHKLPTCNLTIFPRPQRNQTIKTALHALKTLKHFQSDIGIKVVSYPTNQGVWAHRLTSCHNSGLNMSDYAPPQHCKGITYFLEDNNIVVFTTHIICDSSHSFCYNGWANHWNTNTPTM